ncbi:site-specific integrase [Leadbetterella byssophila]|uniref:site-specific integrase n=1 Tax=Leadbetterella byssophila TaxID=316068 RepID=UPI0039A3F1E1
MKYSIKVDLKFTKGLGAQPIRIRVSYAGIRPELRLGYSIEPENWDAEARQVKRGTINKFGQHAKDINMALHKAYNVIERIFTEHQRLHGGPPEVEDLKYEFYKAIGRISEKKQQSHSFKSAMQEFKIAEGSKNAWTADTYEKFDYLTAHWIEYNSNATLNEITEPLLTGWLRYFESKKIRNTTVSKYIDFFKQFLRWCKKAGYYNGDLHDTFRPKFKGTDGNSKEVIYLEWEELMAVYKYKFSEAENHLEKVRDVFCFCCFSGLRYSDVAKLMTSDIRGETIRVVTKKTVDGISIELNKYTKAIIKKYKKNTKENDRLLPVISNQKMNDYLKVVCRLAGVNQPIRTVYFIGSTRYEEVRPKWELMSSHAGRRTFVVSALTLGISESVIMEWTGHNDLKSLKPYKKIVNSLKAREMKKFNK